MSVPRTRLYRLALLLLGLTLCRCAPARALIAANRSTRHFVASAVDARVFYEPGAEGLAGTVVTALPASVATVEARMPGAFTMPVRVYVCATIRCMTTYGADAHAGGLTNNHRVFISPKPENTADRIPRVLVHELSHLHLGQKRGVASFAQLPVWFVEGLAVDISEGAGAEGVSVRDAQLAIAAGHALVPEPAGSVWRRHGATAAGLEQHMFYRQAGLFVSFIQKSDERKFLPFLSAIEHGDSVEHALRDSYGTTIDAAWRQFAAVASHEAGASNAPPDGPRTVGQQGDTP
jgi:hypothetical protein